MTIDQAYLEARKADTIATLKEMGLADDRMKSWLERVGVMPIERTENHKAFWYGCAFIEERRIDVYMPTIATAITEHPELAMRIDGLERTMIDEVLKTLTTIPKDILFELMHQSGMDHELGGHFYVIYKAEHLFPGEKDACEVQIDMAKFRAQTDPHWATLSEIMPSVLGYHKGVDLE